MVVLWWLRQSPASLQLWGSLTLHHCCRRLLSLLLLLLQRRSRVSLRFSLTPTCATGLGAPCSKQSADIISANEIVIENSKTGKVSAVVVLMVFGG